MPAYPYGDTILIGVAGGDFGGNGSVQAFKLADGTKVWEWQTIPGAGRLRSGDQLLHRTDDARMRAL